MQQTRETIGAFRAVADTFFRLKTLVLPLLSVSFISNIAVLVSPIFMMQVLDRVLVSGNFATLLMLLLVAMGAYFAQVIAEFVRDATLSRVSRWVEGTATPIALKAAPDQRGDRVADVGRAADFFRSQLAVTALNIPWLPLFLATAIVIHPLFLALILGLVAAMVGLKYCADLLAGDQRIAAQKISLAEHQTLGFAMEMTSGFGIRAVGQNLFEKFYQLQSKRQAIQDETTSIEALKTSLLGFLRSATQVLALSLGAYLVVQGNLTAGGMIAASIIVSKTVVTLESSLGNISDIRLALASIKALQSAAADAPQNLTEVPELSGQLKVDNLVFPRGGGLPPRLDRISFDLAPGECLAIIGTSGSGKTSLMNSLCGIEHCPIGTVFLDETEIRSLSPDALTRYIGYLPQRADLLDGTISQNISCFAIDPDDEQIIHCAKIAGVHGLISSLPQSYDTDIAQFPFLLSAGQQQRIALARALYFNPRYLFLDEPNALLDADGERQLCDTLARLKEAGITIVMILHRAGIMGLADKVMRLDSGKIADYGNRAEVLQRISAGRQRIELPLNAQSMQDLHDWISAQFARSSDEKFRDKAVMVGTELFNVAGQNRASKENSKVVFTFKFCGDTECEITLIDPDAADMGRKINKMKSVIAHPEIDMLNLPPDEIGLAVVMQMVDDFKIEKLKDNAIYKTVLSNTSSRDGLPHSAKKRIH